MMDQFGVKSTGILERAIVERRLNGKGFIEERTIAYTGSNRVARRIAKALNVSEGYPIPRRQWNEAGRIVR